MPRWLKKLLPIHDLELIGTRHYTEIIFQCTKCSEYYYYHTSMNLVIMPMFPTRLCFKRRRDNA